MTYPVSFSQERILFLDDFSSSAPIYTIPIIFSLRGPFDAFSLKKALQDIIQRHEILRTTFHRHEEHRYVQVIHDYMKACIREYDVSEEESLSGMSESLRDSACRSASIIEQEIHQPFNVSEGPLLRASIIRKAQDDYVLMIVFHHSIFDGFSASIFCKELSEIYNAHVFEKTPELPNLTVHYKEFVLFQKKYATKRLLEKQLAFWKSQLNPLPDPLNLPHDHMRPKEQSFSGATYAFRLPKEKLGELKKLSQRNRCFLFATLLSIYKIFLHKYSQQNSLVVAFPIENRHYPNTENLIGFLANTLLIKTDFNDSIDFNSFAKNVFKKLVEIQDNQDLPFEQLVENLNVQRTLAHNPVFQTMFVLYSSHGTPQFTFHNIVSTPIGRECYKISKFDLTLFATERPDGLDLEFEYATDLFEESTISSMAAHFVELTNNIIATPQAAIADLHLLTEQEQYKILYDWNPTKEFQSVQKCIHQLFEEQAQKHPDSIAVSFEGQKLTYRQINERANRVARCLRELKAGPESLIAIALERSMELPIAILGVLKSGGAYLPLDPSYPKDRLDFVLEDAQVAVLITSKSISLGLSSLSVPQVYIEDDILDRQSCDNLDCNVSPANLAYVIYTSGSTGKPKGVMVEHRNVVRLLTSCQPWFNFNESDVWTLFHSYAFDFSVWEMWGALCYGGKLCIIPYVASRDPAQFHAILCNEKVTVLNQTPSAFRQFIQYDQTLSNVSPYSLRYVIFGGEALDPSMLQPWFGRYGDEKPVLINMYGITETTVHVTYCSITQKDLFQKKSLIGRPIPDLQLYILDPQRQPLPAGVVGELYVGGAGVARGYLRRPQLTSERFIENPFAKEGRLYKTGDLGRFLNNGSVEYLGRIDHQVKIRGFRIELGEIEAVVQSCPLVRSSVILAHEGRLIAYVVLAHIEESPDLCVNLRAYLKERLPEYMVPAAFICLSAFPMTENGKIDRKELLAMPSLCRTIEQQYSSPRNSLEMKLVGIFAELLRVEKVGIYDDFFDLGGHSLLAVQLISKIQAAFAVRIPLKTIFQRPTVSQLAESISNPLTFEPKKQIDFCTKNPNRAPASSIQRRIWFLERMIPNNSLYKIPIAFKLNGFVDENTLAMALEAIVHVHGALRTHFRLEGETLFQIVAQRLSIPIETHAAKDWESCIREIFNKSFDLETGPLMRACLVKAAEDVSIVFFVFHHSIFDGWSKRIFVKQLADIYTKLLLGKSNPNTSISINDTASDYARHTQAQALIPRNIVESELGYWKQRLHSAGGMIDIPLDFPYPKERNFSGKNVSIALTDKQKILAAAKQHQTSLFMLLLSSFQILLHKMSCQEDIVIGTAFTDRRQNGTENAIGPFVNTVPVRSRLEFENTFKEILLKTQKEVFEDFEHQNVTLEDIINQMDFQRSASVNPLFQAFFLFEQDEIEENFPFGGLRCESIDVDGGVSKFDITLAVQVRKNDIKVTFEYATELFEEETIRRLAQRFETVLMSGISNPDMRIMDIPIVLDEEKRLFDFWNSTKKDFSQGKLIHQLIEEQVFRNPDAVALVFQDHHMTYRELHAKASRLAAYLQFQGIRLDEPIAICIERSFSMVVAIVAILRSGGAYVPLDPNYPHQRLQLMLQQSGARFLVTTAQLRDIFQRLPTVVIDIDEQFDVSMQSWHCSQYNAEIPSSSNLAYVIFTSGSTGQPKGVMIEHRSVINCLEYFREKLCVNETTRWLAITPLSFDISALEIFLPLISGGSVVLMPSGSSKEVDTVCNAAMRYKATHIQATPTFWLMFSELGFLPPDGSTILCGGEPLSQKLASYFTKCSARVYNVYGPTETTIWSSIDEVSSSSHITIGSPIHNTAMCILDNNGFLLPIGVTGELYIGGTGLARGYFGQEELTKDRFFFHSETGLRLYRTGDKARYLLNGAIEYKGRNDQQIKLRGFRIELEEIEAVLQRHPLVRQAAVLLLQNGDNKNIVAYLAPKESAIETFVDTVKNHAQRFLPDYMIPNSYCVLNEFPQTPNGKIDRKNFPKIGDLCFANRSCDAPRNSLQLIVMEIWKELLKVDTISITSTFFELGGNSFLSVRLMSRLHSLFHKNIPLAIFFQKPTIEGIVEYLQGDQESKNPLITIQSDGGNLPIFFIHPAGGSAHPFIALAPYFLDHPLYGVSDPYAGEKEAPWNSIKDMASYYAEHILKVDGKQSCYICGWSFGGLIALEMAKLFSECGKKVVCTMLLDTFHPEENDGVIFEGSVAENIVFEEYAVNQERRYSRFMQEHRCSSFSGNIALIKAKERGRVVPCLYNAPQNGWEKQFDLEKCVHATPGNHETFFTQEYIAETARTIGSVMSLCVE